MASSKPTTKTISLDDYGIKNSRINYQLSSDRLQAIAIEKGMGQESSLGALAINTGEFTGRSPQDRFIVKDHITEDKVWWGKINIPFETDRFEALYKKVIGYLDGKELFCKGRLCLRGSGL